MYTTLKNAHEVTLDADILVRRLLPELRAIPAERLERLRSLHRQAVVKEDEEREAARRSRAAAQETRAQGKVTKVEQSVHTQVPSSGYVWRPRRTWLLVLVGCTVLMLAVLLGRPGPISIASSNPVPSALLLESSLTQGESKPLKRVARCHWEWSTKSCTVWSGADRSVSGPIEMGSVSTCRWCWRVLRCKETTAAVRAPVQVTNLKVCRSLMPKHKRLPLPT